MAKERDITNVYTILDKAKKGELDGYYDRRSSFLSRVNFYQRPDLIKPYVHYIDEYRLKHIVDSYVNDSKHAVEAFDKFSKTTGFIKIDPAKKPDLPTFFGKVKETYKKFPEHIKNDIFRLYYSRMQHLDFAERTDNNHTKYKFLEYANNPVSKIMTEGSNLKSSIFVRNLMLYFAMHMTQMEYLDPDQAKEIQKGLSKQDSPQRSQRGGQPQPGDGDAEPGDGQPGKDPQPPSQQPPKNQSKVDDAMRKLIESPQGKEGMDKAIKEATTLCNKIDGALDADQQEDIFMAPSDGGSNAGKLDTGYMEKMVGRLEAINLSLGAMKDRIKKLLDKSVSYFSAQKITIFEDIFTSDNIAGLDDYLLLHPRLMKLCMEDIMIRDTQNVGKIDIYIDISSSMNASCGVLNKQNNAITKMDFSKAFAAKLADMNMLNDVYVFNGSTSKYRNDKISLAMLDASGGTSIDSAVRMIRDHPTNALVITDAEDACTIYTEKAYFVGVRGANFGYFRDTAREKYAANNQMVVFDGTTIHDVDAYGKVIKKK